MNRPSAPEVTSVGPAAWTDEDYLTPDELSACLKIPVKTLAAWRSKREGPLFHRMGVHVRYLMVDLDAWRAERAEEARKWMAS